MESKNLPKRFVILKDHTNDLWRQYVAWLNEKFNLNVEGSFYGYYGVNDTKFNCMSTSDTELAHYAILTLEQWAAIAMPEYEVSYVADKPNSNNMKTINELCVEVHQNAKSKGFYDEPKNTGEMLALIHSEVSEALEADRKDSYCTANLNVLGGWVHDDDFQVEYKAKAKGTFEEEMADIVIRVFDMCGYKGIDLQAHVEMKMRFNALREHKHGKKY